MSKNLGIFIFFAVFLSACSSGTMSDSEKRTAACTYAQIEIEGMLKSPSSADFPACSQTTIEETGTDKFSVEGYVDAQNSFGASVREYYTCSVRLEDDDDSYYINCNLD